MSSVRPLERDDLEQVAGLFLRVVRPGSKDGVSQTASYFEKTTLDHPWADPEIPSLVFENGRREITGFVGSYVARMRLDGTPVRAACPGNLVAAPEAEGSPPGALLLREHMNGPQDVTFVDTLGERSRLMWKGLGGELSFLGALSWIRLFRPFALARERFLGPRLRAAAPLAAALDAGARRVARGPLCADGETADGGPLEADAVVRELPRLAGRMSLRPDYDEGYLRWLFDELERPRRSGTLVRRLVHQGSRVLGWYVYRLKPGGVSRVLQLVAGERDAGAVVDHLFRHAEAGGAAALEGRLEARLLQPLAERRCLFRYAGAAGVKSADQEILDAVLSGRCLFTRMDSEYWPVPPRT